MNLVDVTVTAIKTEPYKKVYDHGEYWMVDIEYTSYGRDSESTEIFKSKSEAKKLSVGDTLQK